MNRPSDGGEEVSNFTLTLLMLETASKYSNSDIKVGFFYFIRIEQVYALCQL